MAINSGRNMKILSTTYGEELIDDMMVYIDGKGMLI